VFIFQMCTEAYMTIGKKYRKLVYICQRRWPIKVVIKGYSTFYEKQSRIALTLYIAPFPLVQYPYQIDLLYVTHICRI